MEPEVHIIEKYFQEILHCFTMTNIKCRGGKEVDLLAINPRTLKRYHVESRVSTTFKLKLKATHKEGRISHRNGLDYFQEAKFEHPHVREKIIELFKSPDYEKILVVWDTDPSVAVQALLKYRIQVWFIDDLLEKLIAEAKVRGSRDDVLRVIELTSLLRKDAKRKSNRQMRREIRRLIQTLIEENWNTENALRKLKGHLPFLEEAWSRGASGQRDA